MHILLIEDEKPICELLISLFAAEDIKVLSSLDMAEIEVLLSQVDLVISDYNMGLDFDEIRIGAEKAGTPLLLISGSVEASKKHSQFLAKPFDFQKLLQIARSLVSSTPKKMGDTTDRGDRGYSRLHPGIPGAFEPAFLAES